VLVAVAQHPSDLGGVSGADHRCTPAGVPTRPVGLVTRALVVVDEHVVDADDRGERRHELIGRVHE
jgi:hypothetical protein